MPAAEVTTHREGLVSVYPGGLSASLETQMATDITPAIGSMSTGLHPFLALWAVLLALSSLARYEPAIWSQDDRH